MFSHKGLFCSHWSKAVFSNIFLLMMWVRVALNLYTLKCFFPPFIAWHLIINDNVPFIHFLHCWKPCRSYSMLFELRYIIVVWEVRINEVDFGEFYFEIIININPIPCCWVCPSIMSINSLNKSLISTTYMDNRNWFFFAFMFYNVENQAKAIL